MILKKVIEYTYNSIYPINTATKRRHIQVIPEWLVNELAEWNWWVACPERLESLNKNYISIINEVGQKLAEKCDRPDFEWKFFVKNDNSLFNATCFPGGKMFITNSLIQKLDPKGSCTHHTYDLNQYDATDLATFKGRIAAVLGHEMAHACAAHGASKLQFSIFFMLISSVSEAVAHFFINIKRREKNSFMNSCVTMIFSAASALLTQHHSPLCEIEADILAMKYASLADYDINEMVEFQQKLGYPRILCDNWLSIPWLNFHPISRGREQRCANIQEILKKSLAVSDLSLESIQTQLNQME